MSRSFVALAGPLLDRVMPALQLRAVQLRRRANFARGMEVIKLAGYVYEEKLAIANQYLIPQTIASQIQFQGSMSLHVRGS